MRLKKEAGYTAACITCFHVNKYREGSKLCLEGRLRKLLMVVAMGRKVVRWGLRVVETSQLRLHLQRPPIKF